MSDPGQSPETQPYGDAGVPAHTAPPSGPDPVDIPDPMPEELQPSADEREQMERVDPMAGEAPTG